MPAGTAAVDGRVRDQLNRLATNPAVARLCGEPYVNNYVIILPRRGVGAETCAAAIGTSTAGLNAADRLLLGWCEQLIAEQLIGDRSMPAARQLCGEWRAHIESGENLVGATFAVHLFHQLAQSLPLASLLSNERLDITRTLQNTDPAVRDICRLNGFVPLQVLEPLTGLLLTELERCDTLAAVERIEVAQDLGPELSGPADGAPEFPTLLLYLHTEACPRQLRTTLDIFSALTTGAARPGVPPTQFAIPIGPAATFSQGFRLFKHYLYPLGLLDTVYDADWHHALTSIPAAPPVPDAPEPNAHVATAHVATAAALRRLLTRPSGTGSDR